MKELLFITAILGILHSCGDLKKNEELEKQMEEFVSLYQQEKNLEVISLGEKLLKNKPDDIEVMFGLANAYTNIDSMKQAIELCNRILEIDSTHYFSYQLLGVIHQIDSNYAKAIQYYLKVLSLRPTYASTYLNLGKIYETIPDKSEAIKCYLNAIDLFINHQFYNEVNELCYHVLQMDSTNSTAYTYWAKLFIENKEYEKAAEMLQYALNSNPSDAFACLTLGKMCHDIGKHENVALFLEQAIKCDSIYHSQGFANQTDITLWAYLYLMDHYKVINETDKSKDYFHQAWVRDKEITKEYINYLENANK